MNHKNRLILGSILLILGVIGNNNTRKNFNDILNSVPGISKTILSKRLKELIDLNIILKDENNIITYGLTNKGIKIRKGLIEFLNATL
jgi:DNA-binding HxlR family transcriptional regulator